MILPPKDLKRITPRRLAPSLIAGAIGLAGLCAYNHEAWLQDADAAASPGSAQAPAVRATAEQSFDQTILPFLDTYCLNCHDDTIQRGEVDLSNLSVDSLAKDAPLWRLVHEQVAHRNMPPPGKDQPTEDERIAVADWIDQELNAAFAKLPQRGGPALSRRLTAQEFDRSIRDLTGLDRKFSAEFPADGGGGEGFTNNASTLFMSPLLITKVLETSSQIAAEAQVTWADGITFGNRAKNPSSPASFNRLLKQALEQRGVFKNDVAELERYLVLTWQYGQAKRKDRKLSVTDFATANNADAVFLDNLYNLMRGMRAPRGADKSVSAYFSKWAETRRIRVTRGQEEQALAQAKEIAKACVELVKQNREAFSAYFIDAKTKRERIDAGDAKSLEKLVFFLTQDQLLSGLEGDDRRRFEGHWIASRLEANDREAKRDAERFVSQMLADFAERAWRRPIEDFERADFAKQYRTLTGKDEKTFEQAVRVMLRGVFVSPHFLFRFESQPKPGEQVDVAPYEMASRLSYFFWGSMPDDELIELAAQGKLQDEEVLRDQAKRMLSDDRSDALAESFFGEWIGYVDLRTQEGPDTTHFPEWQPELALAMVEQAQRAMTYMIREDRPYTDLIDADYLFVNGMLAQFMGISGVHGEQWQRISGANQSRFGVAGLPAVHVMTSHANRTSPVKRGDWLLATLLGTPTPPPPPNVGELEEAGAAASAASLREQLEAHRNNIACASCHNRIDPLGFPLERFDALGRMRSGELDLKGELPSGQVFSGPDGLRDVLMSRKALLRRQLVVKTLGYALGRGLQLEDEPVVKHIEKALEKDPRLSVLFTEVVLSPAFRTKISATQ